MALKARIDGDLKTALLGGDKFAAQVLRGVKAAILNEEVATGKRDVGLEDSVIEQVIAREVKKRNESAVLYEQNDRAESAAEERKEIEILSVYLPTQLSEAELLERIHDAIASTGATGPADMGKVIGAVKASVGTAADGAVIASLVKQTLTK
jgi:uncharacterized protein YqeY